LSVIDDARRGLVAAMGQGADKVKIIRVSLINGVDLNMEAAAAQGSDEPMAAFAGAPANQSGISVVNYKLPIKLGFGALKFAEVSPMQTCKICIGVTYANFARLDLEEIFREAGIRAQKFVGDEVLAMENSKLFLNLIGVAAAVEGFDAGAGWRDATIFKKEIAMLKEFVVAVKKSGEGFVGDLGGYPVDFFAKLALLPVWLILPFRGMFARVIAKGRNRPKDLSEIDYYNGEVVRLGKRAGVAVPVNEEVVAKAKNLKSNDKQIIKSNDK